jgi:hypothetical protein
MGMAAKTLRLAAAVALSLPLAHPQAPPNGAIEGDVVDVSTGRGIADARVRLQSVQDDPLYASTDAQGHFRFDGLEIRAYQAFVRYPGFASPDGGALEASALAVTPGRDGQVSRIRLNLQWYAAITGKVVNVEGNPAEGVTVEVYRRDSRGGQFGAVRFDDGFQYVRTRTAKTDELGEYRLAPLGPGSYYVLVRAGSAPARDTFYPQAVKVSAAKLLELDEGKELRADVQVVQQLGVKVSGRMLGGSAQPGLRASVALSNSSLGPGGFSRPTGDAYVYAIVNGDRFTANFVLPGKYTVWATQHASVDHPILLAVAWREVEVRTEDVDGVDVALAPPAHVEGAVVFESGCAPEPVVIELNGAQDYLFHAGADGRFEPQNIFPGKYKASVMPERKSDAATSVKLGDAEVLADGFELTAENKGPLRVTMGCPGR